MNKNTRNDEDTNLIIATAWLMCSTVLGVAAHFGNKEFVIGLASGTAAVCLIRIVVYFLRVRHEKELDRIANENKREIPLDVEKPKRRYPPDTLRLPSDALLRTTIIIDEGDELDNTDDWLEVNEQYK